MTDEEKLSSDYYNKYVGKYVKRFYTPFEIQNMFKIIGFRLKPVKLLNTELVLHLAYFTIQDINSDEQWEWDVEDCTIISDEPDTDERVAFINNPQYRGHNPYSL